MKQETEAPEIDLSLVKEFEYRKQKIQLIEQGRVAIGRIMDALNDDDDITSVKSIALSFAQQSINLAIENVDNAIVALVSKRKHQSALNAMKFLLLVTVVSNLITGAAMWLILH